MIALGGDGTLLRVGRICASLKLPILGINVGRMGFLYELHHSEWADKLDDLLAGDYRLEQRMMLDVELLNKDHIRGSWTVLNDAFVGRGGVVRPIQITAYVDDYLLTSYMADGLDRGHGHRIDCIRPGCRGANPATGSTQHPDHTGCTSHVDRSRDRIGRGCLCHHQCYLNPWGCLEPGWTTLIQP